MTNFIDEKIERCKVWLRQTNSQFADSPERLRSFVESGTTPAEYEFQFWDELQREFYWRAFQKLNCMLKSPKEHSISDNDLSEIASIMYNQVQEGNSLMGSSVPQFSDTWSLIGEPDSPLAQYVTEGQLRSAVNNGFWTILGHSAYINHQSDAIKQLDSIITYENFFQYYDWIGGTSQAAALHADLIQGKSSFLDFNRLNNLFTYLRWYLVQEDQIDRAFDGQYAADIRGTLAAPLASQLLLRQYDFEYDESLRKLASVFIQGDILKSKAMQQAIGQAFEYHLKHGFWSDDERFSRTTLEICARLLPDTSERAAAVWRTVAGSVELEKIAEEALPYVPQEAYQEYIDGLKSGLSSMARLDMRLLQKWMALRVGVDVLASAHSTVRNKALDVYFSQKSRPSGDDLSKLDNLSHKVGNRKEKLSAYLFADYLLRKRFSDANRILLGMDDWNPKPRKLFMRHLEDYVAIHGNLVIDNAALNSHACYPDYNNIPDFCERRHYLFAMR